MPWMNPWPRASTALTRTRAAGYAPVPAPRPRSWRFFETKDADAAAALVKKLETRNADRIENYSSYIPAEVPKLENAVILSGGRYVVLCVAEDASAVREAAEKALG